MSDEFTRRGEHAQAARRHADLDEPCDREEQARRERALDIYVIARRLGLVVRHRWCGLPGGQTEPYLTRPGSDLEVAWPGDLRR